MTRLKKRPRSDSQGNDVRHANRRRWDRTIYLALLAIFALSIGNYFVGDRVFLRADGLVLRDRTVVSATSLVRIAEVRIRPGQQVRRGDVLFRADSPEILDRLADYAMRVAELDERTAELRGRVRMSVELLPLAREREARLDADLARVGSPRLDEDAAPIRRSSLLTTSRRQTLEGQVYDAAAEVHRLTALVAALRQEIAAVAAARQQAKESIRRLSQYYGEGLHLAPEDGIISGEVPAVGEVFTPGEPMATVLWGPQYILTYLPESYAFGLRTGQDVRVRSGTLVETGMIEQILPVSKSLPDEFQNTFRSRERRQLARIALPPASAIPTHATVRIDRGRVVELDPQTWWASILARVRRSTVSETAKLSLVGETN